MKKLILSLLACASGLLGVQAQTHVILKTKDGGETKVTFQEFQSLQLLNAPSATQLLWENPIRRYLEEKVANSRFLSDVRTQDFSLFVPTASELGEDQDGQRTYATPVSYTGNNYCSALCRTALQPDPAQYAVLLPTDAAYDAAVQQVQPYFRYTSSYTNRTLAEMGGKGTITLDADSMSAFAVRKWVIDHCVFDLSQPNLPAFSGTPAALDNGKVYAVSSLNIPQPAQETRVQCSVANVYDPEHITGTAIDYTPAAGVLPEYEGSFLVAQGEYSTDKPTVSIRLPQLPSGKYDIFLVSLPDYARLDQVPAEEDMLKTKVLATICYQSQEKERVLRNNIEPDPTKLDTVLLFEDFEMPCSTLGIPDTYPYITFTSRSTPSNVKNGYTHTLCLGAILISPKGALEN